MKIAVLSLTRDRLDYTKHCFRTLHERAGLPFKHFVFDQGSQDGTADWLMKDYQPHYLELSQTNIGISKALNRMLDRTAGYDVVVKFDNDCEVVTDGALRDCARFVVDHPGWLVSPRIEGLNSPPGTVETIDFPEGRVLRKHQIGGIFLAANAAVYERFRYDENNPVWGMDDVQLSGGRDTGYLDWHVANHYETTQGQAQRYPEYWERKMAEYNAR